MNPTTEQVLSPGEIFVKREALNLSLEDVAKEITLRPSILEQLENNEFIQKSTPAIFVKVMCVAMQSSYVCQILCGKILFLLKQKK